MSNNWIWSEYHRAYYMDYPDGSRVWASQSNQSHQGTPTYTRGNGADGHSVYDPTPVYQVCVPAPPPPPMIHTDSRPPVSPAVTSTPSKFNDAFMWKLEIPYVDLIGFRKDAAAIALLDTHTQKGNWVSSNLLQRTNNLHQVRPCYNAPVLDGVTGRVSSAEMISFEFRRRGGNRYYVSDFFVLPYSAGIAFDIIFGREFLVEHNILHVNQRAMLPNLVGDALTQAEAQAIAAAEAERRRIQAELQARRAAGL